MSDEVTDSEFEDTQPAVPGTTTNGGRGTNNNKPSIGPDGSVTATGQGGSSPAVTEAEIAKIMANQGQSKVFNIKVKGGPSGPYSAPSYGSFDGPDHLAPSMQPYPMAASGDQEINFFQAQNDGLLLAPPNIQRAINAATGGDPLIADAVYEAALQRTASKTALGQDTNLISNIMEVAKEYREAQKTGGTGGGGGGGGPFRSENTVVNLTNSQKAQEILNNALSVALGRRASASENRAFLAALNLREQENPTKTVTEGVSSGRNSTSSTTTTGGFDNVAFADKFARSQEGYAEYQAATTQMDNFIQALTGNRRRVI